MVRNNHFEGATLADAVKKATAVYGRRPAAPEAKSFCDRLISQFDSQKVKADHLFDRIKDLEREIDGLRDTARAAGLTAALSALGAVGGPLGTLAKVARLIKRLKLGRATKQDLLGIIPVIGPAAGALVGALAAASALDGAKRLEREVERLKADYEDLANELLAIAQDYEDTNCHLAPAMS